LSLLLWWLQWLSLVTPVSVVCGSSVVVVVVSSSCGSSIDLLSHHSGICRSWLQYLLLAFMAPVSSIVCRLWLRSPVLDLLFAAPVSSICSCRLWLQQQAPVVSVSPVARPVSALSFVTPAVAPVSVVHDTSVSVACGSGICHLWLQYLSSPSKKDISPMES